RTGYDPAGVAGMLTTLARLDEASGSRRGVPNWLSTHPAPADRVTEVQQFVREAQVTAGSTARAKEGDLLRYVDGLVFGDSPRQGFVRGSRFLHPVLRFAVTFPERWEVQNSPQQVMAKAPEQDHYMLLQHVS